MLGLQTPGSHASNTYHEEQCAAEGPVEHGPGVHSTLLSLFSLLQNHSATGSPSISLQSGFFLLNSYWMTDGQNNKYFIFLHLFLKKNMPFEREALQDTWSLNLVNCPVQSEHYSF